MPIIRTFVSHHGGDLQARVEPILRRVAPLGIRPWLDKRDLSDRVGLPLDQQLQEALFKGPCSSLSLFLTKAATTRKWIEQEVQWALEHPSANFRILPIWLDPPGEIDLPETFRSFLERHKVLWLEPYKDPRFIEKYAASTRHANPQDGSDRSGVIGTSEPFASNAWRMRSISAVRSSSSRNTKSPLSATRVARWPFSRAANWLRLSAHCRCRRSSAALSLRAFSSVSDASARRFLKARSFSA